MVRTRRYHKLDSADPEKIRLLYWDQGQTCREIGVLYGCSGKSIQKFMERHSIPRRPSGTQITHGLTGSATYRSWKNAKGRCFNKNNPQFRDYGARGIRMCVRWISFESFLEDMGLRPEGMTLDRIDNDGHYSCGHCRECSRKGWSLNCRWASPKEQAYNRRPKSRLNLYFREYGCLECGRKDPPCTPDRCGF